MSHDGNGFGARPRPQVGTAEDETLYVTDSKTGGVKGVKLQRFDLVPVEPQIALAEHYGKNAKEHGGKYEARNWEKGYAWSLSYGAIKRHLEAWWLGEDIDAESGSSHLTAVAWHCFALFWFQLRNKGTDDRPMPLKVAIQSAMDRAKDDFAVAHDHRDRDDGFAAAHCHPPAPHPFNCPCLSCSQRRAIAGAY